MHDLDPLKTSLDGGDWQGANMATRRLLAGASTGVSFDPGFLTANPGLVRDIDRAWSASSDARFGFSTQREIWEQSGGGAHLKAHDLWNSFYVLGEKVGWKASDRREWFALESWKRELGAPLVFPPIEVAAKAADSPRGLFPFHDVLATFDMDGFSPRDCWGEAVWDSWAVLFSTL